MDATKSTSVKPVLRPIRAEDNCQMALVIKNVMTSLGAVGDGYSIVDPEVENMFQSYNKDRHCYFVVEESGEVIGGSGIGPLVGADVDVCELKKMYFLEKARGRGLGLKALNLCLAAARNFNYKECYLETLESMTGARRLYEAAGFQRLDRPMGATGHFKCNAWYSLKL